MFLFLSNLNPQLLACLGGTIAFIFSFSGAALVFVFKKIKKNKMDAILSFSAGIMLAAAFFSLLEPAINQAKSLNLSAFISVLGGFLIGGLFLGCCNRGFKKIDLKNKSKMKRCLLLFTSITLHNIPEGLAIGVAFGNMIYGGSFLSAVIVTLGIAIQNFPEGAAISLPIRRDGVSPLKSFLFGVLSGLVEPISAVIGCWLVYQIQWILPFILAFAAGAMIFVIVFDLIPESQKNNNKEAMTYFFMIGFTLMMILDVSL